MIAWRLLLIAAKWCTSRRRPRRAISFSIASYTSSRINWTKNRSSGQKGSWNQLSLVATANVLIDWRLYLYMTVMFKFLKCSQIGWTCLKNWLFAIAEYKTQATADEQTDHPSSTQTIRNICTVSNQLIFVKENFQEAKVVKVCVTIHSRKAGETSRMMISTKSTNNWLLLRGSIERWGKITTTCSFKKPDKLIK